MLAITIRSHQQVLVYGHLKVSALATKLDSTHSRPFYAFFSKVREMNSGEHVNYWDEIRKNNI